MYRLEETVEAQADKMKWMAKEIGEKSTEIDELEVNILVLLLSIHSVCFRFTLLNTEFYSWDTGFGLVNPRLRNSCLQVVFCVNLGTFFKCFLQLGRGLTGVRSTHTECSLNAP